MRGCIAESLLQCICRLLQVYKQFSPPFVLCLWRWFLWSPWKTSISTLLHSLLNQFSLFCSYSVWVTMATAPKWSGLYMNLFMSFTWSGLECSFFCSQSKHNLLIKHRFFYYLMLCLMFNVFYPILYCSFFMILYHLTDAEHFNWWCFHQGVIMKEISSTSLATFTTCSSGY